MIVLVVSYMPSTVYPSIYYYYYNYISLLGFNEEVPLPVGTSLYSSLTDMTIDWIRQL